ncbi:MAG: DUF2513 domain-containing protein [Planctomycetota bacterium]
MKRDIDLARQLLFDIESEGQDCSITRLRNGVVPETVAAESSDRIRYHLRLLIDAGLVKEVDRTTAGTPCVRLTNAGHELLELARSDSRWRDAKQYTRDSTGGLSLTVIRAVLTKWAVEGVATRRYRTPRRVYRPYYHRVEPRRRYYDYREPAAVRDPLFDDEELRLVRTRPDYRERFDVADTYDRETAAAEERYDYTPEPVDGEVGVSLPIYLV